MAAIWRFISPTINVKNIQHFIAMFRQKIDCILKIRLCLVERPEPQFALDEMRFPEIVFAASDDFRIESLDIGLQKIHCFDLMRLEELRDGFTFYLRVLQHAA